ncbi:GUN4 domain-containing protein, partial [Cylindrospermopsis raciborskii]
MNDLPRQKLKEIIIQHGRFLCDNPQRCEAFLRDYCGEYKREIFLLISALKQGVAKELLNSSNIPIELLLGRLTKQMENDLGLTKEAAQYAVETWAQVLDLGLMESVESEVIPIRYTKLETLLKAQNFREADLETDRVMLAVANIQSEGWLREEDAENFPYKELRTIDNLWLKYSQGKFGISVQQEIYKNLGGTKQFDVNVWRSFGDRVGWRKQGSWLLYGDLNFSLSAPTGHLPRERLVGWEG